MPIRILILAVAAALLASTPLTAQADLAPVPAADTHPATAAAVPAPALSLSEATAAEPARQRWMQPLEQERARAEVNRPRWLFPAAGAVLGGVAGVGYSGEISRSDFMSPVSPYYVLVPLGALAGGLVGWYVDAAQRQWIATRPTP